MRISRRRFITGSTVLAAMGGGLAYARYVEPTQLSLETVIVPLPESLLSRPIRILQLTDFHYSSVVSLDFIEQAFDLGMSASPDIVCFTGDYITSSDLFPIRDLKPLFSRIGNAVPTFACLGNHDGGNWSGAMGGHPTADLVADVLNESGIQVLRNSSTVIQFESQQLRIVGLEDMWSGTPDADLAFAGDVPENTPALVLTHNPDSKHLLAGHKWDLALCGHTHGGQFVIPFLGAPMAPIQDKAFTAGLNDWRERKIYTSRGVGNLFGLRFNCPPEVTVIELQPGA